MTLLELATLARTQIEVRAPDINGQWYACIEEAETKEDAHSSILSTPVGRGYSPEVALRELSGQLKGKHLVINAGVSSRIELSVPDTLEAK